MDREVSRETVESLNSTPKEIEDAQKHLDNYPGCLDVIAAWIAITVLMSHLFF